MALCSLLYLGGCSKVEEPDNRDLAYGHVQFKLYKEASYPGTKADQLEYLGDVAKIKVTLRYGENLISQTMVASAANDEAAEFGLRSDKLKLLAGDYRVLTFVLYDKLDNVVYEGVPSTSHESFTVVAGGLVQHDLLASTVERGKVKFSLVKDLSDFTDTPDTKAAVRSYTFDEISFVTISVRTGNTSTEFEMLPTDFAIHFDETDDQEDGYRTSSFVCDTLLSLRAGNYAIQSYSLFDESRKLLETNDDLDASFVVEDNKVTEAAVPVKLHEADEYIKDYYALYEIWKSLHGPEWRYVGEDYPAGCNWNFNKDPDLWGDQPGVSLHSNGRVALVNISGFGFYGDMSPALGQLTELVELYLGTHNDSNLLHYDPTIAPGQCTARRMERHKEYLAAMHPATQMAEPIARALAENGIVFPVTALYETMLEADIIDGVTGRMRIQPMDLNHGKLCNGLTSLPAEIG